MRAPSQNKTSNNKAADNVQASSWPLHQISLNHQKTDIILKWLIQLHENAWLACKNPHWDFEQMHQIQKSKRSVETCSG
jgi:hypothetical protein